MPDSPPKLAAIPRDVLLWYPTAVTKWLSTELFTKDAGLGERLIPEDIAEAVLPTARALLLRNALQNSGDQRRAQAFAALTAPFLDILPGE